MRRAPKDREAAAELVHSLQTLSSTSTNFPGWLAGRLLEACALETSSVYNLTPAGERVELEFFRAASVHVGMAGEVDRLCRGFLEGQAQARLTFAVDRPAPHERNRTRTLKELGFDASAAPVYREALVPAGLGGCDQLRALVCDGPRMLAWVGGFRRAPFTDDDRRALQALVPALQARLRRESLLGDAGFARAGLEAALQALPNPAWLVGADGELLLMNEPAAALWQREGWVRESLRAPASEPLPAGFERIPVQSRGVPPHYLVLLSELGPALEARVAEYCRLHRLSPRRAQVVALIARGRSNKAIASELGCSVRTVELHVSAVLRATGCDNRTQLASRAVRAR